MIYERGTAPAGTFEAVLDETCERLWETRVRYSLRRIAELDQVLSALEWELDETARRQGWNCLYRDQPPAGPAVFGAD